MCHFLFGCSRIAVEGRTGALLHPWTLVHVAGVTRSALAHRGARNYAHRLPIPSSAHIRRGHYGVFTPLKWHIGTCYRRFTLCVVRSVTFGGVEPSCSLYDRAVADASVGVCYCMGLAHCPPFHNLHDCNEMMPASKRW